MGDMIRIYDVLLIIALIGTAWKVLFGREAFTSTVFFIVYGLLMAMAWVQLGAIDVALAEACIGAGLTGALLIGAVRQFEPDPKTHTANRKIPIRLLVGILSSLTWVGVMSALTGAESSISPIPSLVDSHLHASGSSHPVTAMLLNFRAFDTWLELGVLLLASIAAISIHQIYDRTQIPKKLRSIQAQPRIIARTMFPLLVLVGGVVLWFGSRAPGGAFQAGALIGAAGILLQIGGERAFLKLSSLQTRFVLALGFFSFLVVATLTSSADRRILEYSPSMAGGTILLLEVAATLSIALTLNVMYACSHPWGMRK